MFKVLYLNSNCTCLDVKLIGKKDILKLRIVLTTEGTAGILYMMGIKSGTFTHIFIDEAGQTTEPEILLALCMSLLFHYFKHLVNFF